MKMTLLRVQKKKGVEIKLRDPIFIYGDVIATLLNLKQRVHKRELVHILNEKPNNLCESLQVAL